LKKCELFGIELVKSETEAKVVVSNGNKLLIGDDSLINNSLELSNENSHRMAHKFLHIM
jgi:hypothetical protein